jgi:processive 1,2-diacylglycerol beta-glucosyltransferase
MKKIFIMYASAGQGHTKAAQVMYRFLMEHEPGADIRLLDALDYSSPALKFAYEASYNFIIRHAQWLWVLVFYATSLRLPFGLSRALNDFSNHCSSQALFDMLARENPDSIISTHFLPCQVAAWLKRRGIIRSFLTTGITDFGVHPLWVAKETDMYAVASVSTQRQLERMGVNPGTIVVTGIPVDPGNVAVNDVPALRAALGIPAGMFTVLLVTGSFGIGPLDEIAELLCRDCQVLVVCARNKVMYTRLSACQLPNVKVYGFVQNMNELMAASDLVVTKPGGLSVSELLVRCTVPVFICAIPGQESENVHALRREGIGTYCRSPKAVRKAVLAFKEHPQQLAAMREAIARVRKPRSAEEIWHALRARCTSPAG